MGEWKMALAVSEEVVGQRLQRLSDLVSASNRQLQVLTAALSTVLSQPEEKPAKPQRNAPPPSAQRRSATALTAAVRKSVPALISPKNAVQRQSFNRNQIIAAAAASTKRKANPILQKPQPPKTFKSLKQAPVPARPSASSSKKTEELPSGASASEFSGTAFADADNVQDVSSVSPIDFCEAHSRESGEDFAIIEQELAALQ